MRLLGLLGSIPHMLILRAATYALAFTLGASVGNYHATKAALLERERTGAETMRKNHEILFAEFAKRNAELKAAIARARDADKAAYAVMAKGKADAEKGRREAEKRLAAVMGDNLKLKDAADGLRMVNELLASEDRPNPGCSMPPLVRNAIDNYIASINNHPDIGNPEAFAPGVSDGANSSLAPLTCGQLTSGMTAVLEHDAMVTALVLSWQQWATEALR